MPGGLFSVEEKKNSHCPLTRMQLEFGVAVVVAGSDCVVGLEFDANSLETGTVLLDWRLGSQVQA